MTRINESTMMMALSGKWNGIRNRKGAKKQGMGNRNVEDEREKKTKSEVGRGKSTSITGQANSSRQCGGLS